MLIDWNKENPKKYIKKFFKAKDHTDEDVETCIGALTFLINNKNDKDAALTLGSMYYTGDIVEQDFKLAKKYYEIGEKLGSAQAGLNLGYIYYYGRCDGKPNYEKAFKCFSKASNSNTNDEDVRSEALYKLSDMYWNGQFVEEDKLYAQQLVYPLLYEENSKHGFGEPNVLGDILYRLARFTSIENCPNYNVYLNHKYARLAKKVISDRHIGSSWWGDTKLLENLDKLNNQIDEYCNNNKISFNNSIDNPQDYKLSSLSESILHWECDAQPMGVVESKVKSGNVCLMVACYGEYVSIPEINYFDTANFLSIVFEDCEIQKPLNIEDNMRGKFNICSKKDGVLLFIGDNAVAELKQNHKSKVYIGEIVKITNEGEIVTKKADFELYEYFNEIHEDA